MLEATEESGGLFAIGLVPEDDLSPAEAREQPFLLPLAFVPPSTPFEFRVALPGEPFDAAIISCWPGDVDPWLADPVVTEPIAITSE